MRAGRRGASRAAAVLLVAMVVAPGVRATGSSRRALFVGQIAERRIVLELAGLPGDPLYVRGSYRDASTGTPIEVIGELDDAELHLEEIDQVGAPDAPAPLWTVRRFEDRWIGLREFPGRPLSERIELHRR